jgi:very-short-patch-repair endonuclease
MRHAPTPAEDRLWQHIRNRKIAGSKFRRQYTIERFIVDFICMERRLIIEVDGDVHQYQQEHDAIRQEFLESRGFRVLRFGNEEVLSGIEGVVEGIQAALQGKSAPL